MITTIKISEEVKAELNAIRKDEPSYDALLKKILHERANKKIVAEMKKGYQSMSKDEYEEFKEWEQFE